VLIILFIKEMQKKSQYQQKKKKRKEWRGERMLYNHKNKPGC